ncbi:ATP-binding protein [Pseudomonas sp. GCM10022188]|uniref:ATP-binding protein n=1 Tax=Pseudomonas TaxID=286 RepID=UPI001E401374|nr:ATP-binding protein [Pseudomonas oryzagri]MCC6073672.1 ATP-binding protein [Pseudomonas oryzagri]
MNLWNKLGFSDNPYSPRPIQGDEQGVKLLVGRDKELRRLTTYLKSSDTHPTLEGPNGVGKTSLVAVAGFLLKKEFSEGASQQALIPISEPFQLTVDDSAAVFKRRVLFRVAQAFIDNHDLLKSKGYNIPDSSNVARWLNSPILSTQGGGLNVAGVLGVTANSGSAANTSVGFSEDGFTTTVLTWLRECFPTSSSGGFICTIDNLELLETSKNARALLEGIRDEVLGVKGLRWVLCGARGITRSVASSPRLQGVLAEPILINPIADQYIENLITERLEVFKLDDEAIAPVDSRGFGHLYAVGGRNLRNAMKYSEDFSFWAVEHGAERSKSDDLYGLIEAWMAELADQYSADTSSVGGRAWGVFEKLASTGGNTSPSQYEEFGFESNQAMRPHLRSLEEANLIESAIDDTDNRRKTIGITSRGWIVNYMRSGFSSIEGKKN